MIRCPACQTENKPSTRFCRECGASLPAMPPAPEDNDATILISPVDASARQEPTTTIELAVKRIAPEAEPPKPAAADNDMTVLLPKKSPPKPKYEPAPPTITGPLTEPPRRSRHATSHGAPGSAASGTAARKSMTPVIVLSLLAIAGGSAGYLGWLMLKKHKAGTETEQVAAVTPAPAAQVVPVAPPPPATSAPAPVSTEAAPVALPPTAAATSSPSTPPPKVETAPATQQPAAPAQQPSAQTVASAAAKPDESLTAAEKRQLEKAKADAAKKEKLEKQKKTAGTAPVAVSAEPAPPPPRPADTHRAATPAPEPAPRQEASPIALLRDELRACEAQNLFKREFCKHQARQRHCAGLWDQVPECPSKKDEKLY